MSQHNKQNRRRKKSKRDQERRRKAVERSYRNNSTRVVYHGDGSRTLRLGPESQEIVRQQREAFIAKFGREPTGNDPLFFDPNKAVPTHYDEDNTREMWEGAIAVAKEVGIRPEILHAMKKTGRVVTEDNMHLLTEEDLDEWDDAVEEWRSADAETRKKLEKETPTRV